MAMKQNLLMASCVLALSWFCLFVIHTTILDSVINSPVISKILLKHKIPGVSEIFKGVQ